MSLLRNPVPDLAGPDPEERYRECALFAEVEISEACYAAFAADVLHWAQLLDCDDDIEAFVGRVTRRALQLRDWRSEALKNMSLVIALALADCGTKQ